MEAEPVEKAAEKNDAAAGKDPEADGVDKQ